MSMVSTIPSDYEERVYAGVLGKIIGVYLGRPFEGWTYERIMQELGEVNDYVNDRIAHHPPLIVTDDDISGTFTFVRALPDYDNSPDLTAAQIGQTWLNYLIERQTILWWGGMGNSTEHTAYQRLKQGITAPRSGSMALNGQVVAEQIGAQIFIDGWAMVAPGNPVQAAELARKAASVSHDGEAIYGAQVLAAMEAQAFVESDMDQLFDVGLSFVPQDSLIAQLIGDIRAWRKTDDDWHKTRARIAEKYGYDKYGGNCHMIPNHAVIILALAYCEDSFQRALMIGNTAGWDTDCNSGNIGCLMGIKNGLRGIDAGPVDWRGPVADRMYLPTADGGRCITDAVQEAYRLARIGRALVGRAVSPSQAPHAPEASGRADSFPHTPAATGRADSPPYMPRFNFELRGSVQGFQCIEGSAELKNVGRRVMDGQEGAGSRSLAIILPSPSGRRPSSEGRDASGDIVCVSTATFMSPEASKMPGYGLIASPTLYPGQTIRACITSDVDASVSLFVRVYNAADEMTMLTGDPVDIHGGESKTLQWLPEGIDGGSPIADVGLRIVGRSSGAVYLDYLTWEGAPKVTFTRPKHNGTMWQRAWVKACNDLNFGWGGVFRICQDSGQGMGLLMQGEREWASYTVQATIVPHLAKSAGIAACVQGLKRYYALLLCDDQKVRLVKEYTHLPGEQSGQRVLAEADCAWKLDGAYDLSLTTHGDMLTATVNGQPVFEVRDTDHPLLSGAVALVIEDGRLDCNAVSVK